MRRIPPEVLQLQVDGYRAMTPARKLEIAAGLRAFAWEVKVADLRRRHPDLPEASLQQLVGEQFRNAGA